MEYPPQCPCPMQQSCPKNVHTGPHIGSNNGSNNNNISNSGSNNNNNNNNNCSAMSHLSNNSNSTLMNGNNDHNISSNNKSSSMTNHSQHSSNSNSNHSSNSSLNNSLTTSRGPVKNSTTTTLTTTATITSAPVATTAVALAATTPTQIDELLLFGKEQSQQHLDLLQVVKSELKLEDSDNKSQYEESVVQPPTPPESYSTNDEKLLDSLTEHKLSSASLPAALEEANTKLLLFTNKNDSKLTIDNSRQKQSKQKFAGNNRNIAAPVLEAYDLTTATVTPPPSTSVTTTTTTTSSNNTNANANANANTTSTTALPLVGRKARIGKTMAREMVYAGAAANAAAQTQNSSQVLPAPMIQVRTLPQQLNTATKQQQSHTQRQQQQQQAQTQFVALQPEQLLNVISPSPQVPATLSESFPVTTTIQSPLQAPFLIKTEIKAEKIKLEDEDQLLSSVLQLQQQQESNHDKHSEKTEVKLIKAEPLTLACEEVTAVMNDAADNTALKPLGRMRLLPSWQQPPVIQCDIDLSTTSDDDVLDLCQSPTTSTSGCGQKSRLKILNLPKAQQLCKKSSPNGYKSLIKQTEPRTYLCLSGRKLDKRGRYSKLQIRQSGRAGGVNGTFRRRQLVLTDQQKKQLKLRKKKLQALERRKQEVLEKRRAAAKQERLQRKKLLKKSLAASDIKQEQIEPCLEEIVDLVEEPEPTESEFSEITQPEMPTMRMLLSESSSLSSGSNSNSSSSMSTLRITPKPSPKRGKPPRKTCVPLHLLETIDSVARGYFSEPETSRCSGAQNHYTSCGPADSEQAMDKTVSGRKQKKDEKASAEKRSKSETKKPIKTAAAANAASEVIDVDYTLTTARAKKTTSTTEPASASCDVERNAPLDLMQGATYAVPAAAQIETVSHSISTNKSTKSKRTPAKRKTAKAKKPKKQTGNKKKGSAKSKQQDCANEMPVLETDAAAPVRAANQLPVETNNNIYDKCRTENASMDEADRYAQMEVEADDDESSASASQEITQLPQQQPPLEKHSNAQVFLPPVPPMPRIVCQPHHGTKRTRSRSKFGSRKRQKVKHSTVSFELDDRLPPAIRGDVVPKWNNGWTWEGEPFQGAVFLNSDDPLVIRTCYPAMRHSEGDIIRTRDCVLLKANEDNDLPYVAKVAHLWENPEDGEMMMSLLWYYRPEHTEQGRQPNDSPDEVYASRHRDHNSVACIEDKCYVLTFSEYCRYRRRLRAAEEDIEEEVSIVPKRPNFYSIRTVPDNTNPELVMFCRRAYEFRTRRLLKMPNKQDYIVVNG